jgi:prepilin-type N-terminal cleavage/methylation domain-containing protein
MTRQQFKLIGGDNSDWTSKSTRVSYESLHKHRRTDFSQFHLSMQKYEATLIHRRHGFSLIELLVVIFVVGVLAAITVVGISGVRKSADQIDGLSALRNVGMAMAVYTAENQGILPWSSQDGQLAFRRADPENSQLLHQLIPYFGVEVAVGEVIPGTVGRAYLRDREFLLDAPYWCIHVVQFEDGTRGRAFGRMSSGGTRIESQRLINIARPNAQVAIADADNLWRREDGSTLTNLKDPLYKNRLVLYFDWRVEAVDFDHNYYYRKLW